MDANLAAALGYPISIIAIIVLCTEKENQFVKFHALQSLLYHVGAGIAFGVGVVVLMLVGFLVSALGIALAGAAGNNAGGLVGILLILGWGLFYVFLMLAPFAILAGNIIGAVKAYNGSFFRIPIVGKFAANFAKLDA
jgi:uncharacterized membrane protein